MVSVVDQNNVVLVTGGTGSFGSTMVRRLLASGVGQIWILSRGELKLHEMRAELGNDRVKFHLGDVRSYDSVERAMRSRRVGERARVAVADDSGVTETHDRIP